MKTESLVIIVVALVIGGAAGYMVANAGVTEQKSVSTSTKSMEEMMNTMNAELEGKTGDEFDKAFMAEMTVHHKGAIVMAELALKNAKHQEIKDLASAIISAQKEEISDMKAWQKEWYGTNMMMGGMNH